MANIRMNPKSKSTPTCNIPSTLLINIQSWQYISDEKNNVLMKIMFRIFGQWDIFIDCSAKIRKN